MIPIDEEAILAQELSFKKIEELQKSFIDSYNILNNDQKYAEANFISSLFVQIFLNGDGASFKKLVGTEHKGLMTQEELKNIKRDYDIAVRKKENNEFKTFLLLDLIPYSNRRADSIIITNKYEIELYDFSEGSTYDRIKACDKLTESEIKQKKRKEVQQQRIDSYKNKIKMDCSPIDNIIIDGYSISVKYINFNAKFYDFNYFYNSFKDNNYSKTYIPNSVCFFLKKEDVSFPFIAFPLKHNIDSPMFINFGRPFIDQSVIGDIYKNNVYIGLSIFYIKLFIDNFTYFKIIMSRTPDKISFKSQFFLKNKKGIKEYVFFEDTRNGNQVPICYGFIYMHIFSNISIESVIIYISIICNGSDDEFSRNIIKYDELANTDLDFFVID